ncbi:hypothetical protein [Streptomyces sp. NPDC060031]
MLTVAALGSALALVRLEPHLPVGAVHTEPPAAAPRPPVPVAA